MMKQLQVKVLGLALGLALSAGGIPALAQSDTGNDASTSGVMTFYNHPGASSTGQWILFVSKATDLVSGQTDTNGVYDVFLRDRVAGTTILVSRATGSTTTTANGTSDMATLSADGRYVAYRSLATDLVSGQVDTNSTYDLFLFDRTTGTTALISRAAGTTATAANSGGDLPRIGANGTVVAFLSSSTNLVTSQVDTNWSSDVFLFDIAAGTLRLASRKAGTMVTAANGASQTPTLSADGRYVAFSSLARDMITGLTDGNFTWDVFVFDRVTGVVRLVSRSSSSATTTANGASSSPFISADAFWVAFQTDATNLGVGDVNSARDVWMFSQSLGTNSLVSRRALLPLRTADNGSDTPVISADGRYVAYTSRAKDLITSQNTPAAVNVFVWDRVNATTTLVSRAAGSSTQGGNASSSGHHLSSGGTVVSFNSDATDLVSGQVDANNGLSVRTDAFVFDLTTQVMALVSRGTAGATTTASLASWMGSASSDGAFAVFSTAATDVISGLSDLNGVEDVFVFDRSAGTTELVSRQTP